MNIVSRYLTRNIALAIAFVLFGFIALFAFFDFINELDDIGKGAYKVQHALAFVLLEVPSHIYELMPIACVIGAIYALAQLAANSEFTAMRAAGLGRRGALVAVLTVGVACAVFTIIVGEFLAPPAEKLGQQVRLLNMGVSAAGQFRSGVWLKDTPLSQGAGQQKATRFVNVGEVRPDGQLLAVKIFEFDKQYRLSEIIEAKSARFARNNEWQLATGKSTKMQAGKGNEELLLEATETLFSERTWISELNPDIFSVLLIDPTRMSAYSLVQYVRHLEDNKQQANRYEIAMWQKLIYPLAAVVMVFLALPFAYLQARAGGIGVKVFAGIMLGISFHFMNGLFSHLGLLNTWPPLVTVIIPPTIALMIAIAMLAWVDRT